MNHDWPWLAVAALAVPAGLGHLWHLILSVNIISGLGYREAVMDRVRTTLFGCFWATSALLLWCHFRTPYWSWSGPAWGYAILCVISGALVWPLCSLVLALRQHPEGIARSAEERPLAGPGERDELIGDSRRSWLLRLPGNDAFRLSLREYDVAIAGLPESLAGLRIVQISDLHMAPCFRRRYFERVIAACQDWEADLLFLTGDIVDHDEAIAWIEPLLAPLGARLGKYAILGNHDEDHQPRAIVGELAKAGFETLEGQWTTIDVDESTIAIGGTSAPWGPDVEPNSMPPADLRIFLSHSPDRFYRAARWGIDLMFSGHNHGGQIRLPLVGAVFMPSMYSRRFDRGFFRRGRTLMYVNEGIAGMHPFRYGCRPEVTRFVLKSAPSSASSPGLEGQTAHGRKHAAIERDWVQS
ncbi:MAG: metallophosphoesterase [Isosphaeraceae bacterium]